MRFIGVDLAWGGRNPSGLAVLDASGNVVAEGQATRDRDVAAFVAAHDGDGAVLGLDAPLVVRNPAGTRPCESELQRRYGGRHAGPYSTNLARLGGRVRARELVARLPRPYLTCRATRAAAGAGGRSRSSRTRPWSSWAGSGGPCATRRDRPWREQPGCGSSTACSRA